jgi:hypothetical protein
MTFSRTSILLAHIRRQLWRVADAVVGFADGFAYDGNGRLHPRFAKVVAKRADRRDPGWVEMKY